MCSVTQLCLTLCDSMDCSLSGSTGFSRQGYWSGLPFPIPGDLPDPGMEPTSPVLWVDPLPLTTKEDPPPRPIMTQILSDQGPTINTTFKLNFLMRSPSPNVFILGVRASIYKFWGGGVQTFGPTTES